MIQPKYACFFAVHKLPINIYYLDQITCFIYLQNMERYLFGRIPPEPDKQRQVKYLSKYTNLRRHTIQQPIPLVLPATEPPPTYMEIIEKYPIELNQIKKVKQLRIKEDKQNNKDKIVSDEVLKRFKMLKKVFKRTHRAQEVFIENQTKKQIRSSNTSHQIKRMQSKKFCPPPFGYYDNNYSQVQRRIPSLNISRSTRKASAVRSVSPSVDVNYSAIQPRPHTFNMRKQLSRDKGSNHNIFTQPDVRILQSEYQFNCLQQKKYPMSVPYFKIKSPIDKKIFPISMSEINNMNMDILKKYNFSQNDKKMAFLKKFISKKE